MAQSYMLLSKQSFEGKNILELPYKEAFKKDITEMNQFLAVVFPDGENLNEEEIDIGEIPERLSHLAHLNLCLSPDLTTSDDVVNLFIIFV